MSTERMTTEQNIPADSRRAIVEGYLQALASRDVAACSAFFTEDAVIHFQSGVFKGTDAIKDWHESRFAAAMEVVKVDDLSVNGEKAVLSAVVTSAKLRAWKIGRLGGKATFLFDGERFKEVKFKSRVYNPLEGW